MLRKLIGYEFRSTYRTYLAVYGAMLILCTVTGALDRVDRLLGDAFPVLGIFLVLSGMFLFTAIIITTVLNLSRFYKGLFKDEGYLVHTLPVPAWQILAAKLLPAVVWTVSTAVMMVLSMGLMALASVAVSGQEIWNLFESLLKGLSYATWDTVLAFLRWGIMGLMALICFILQIYASITLGQQVPKHPVGAAVLIWFVINLIQTWSFNLIWTRVIEGFTTGLVYAQTAADLVFSSAIHAGIWWNTLFYLLWAVLFWVATQMMLQRKLNVA